MTGNLTPLKPTITTNITLYFFTKIPKQDGRKMEENEDK